jgi:hypothetical protein
MDHILPALSSRELGRSAWPWSHLQVCLLVGFQWHPLWEACGFIRPPSLYNVNDGSCQGIMNTFDAFQVMPFNENRTRA